MYDFSTALVRPFLIAGAVILSLLGIIAGVGLYAASQHKQVAALTSQVSELTEARSRDAKAASVHDTATSAAKKKEKVQSDQLNQALVTEPVWASQPVPASVCAALGLCPVANAASAPAVPESN